MVYLRGSMNRPRGSSIAHATRSRILRGGMDRFWTYADFPNAGRSALAAALSRLAKEGVVRRVRRGVYYRPLDTVLGKSSPDPEALVDTILGLRGARAVASGLSQYNRLGLTTQVSGTITRSVPRRVHLKRVSGIPVYLSERPLEKQEGIRPEERTALDALRDLSRIPDSSARDVLERLRVLLVARRLKFERLARFALSEPPRVRALMGALGEDILMRRDGGKRMFSRGLRALRAKLNPLTSYQIRGAAGALRRARAWRIR